MTKIAIIGCGFFAQNHLHAWKQLAANGAEIVAVCDTDRAKAAACADAFGIQRHYADAEEMLDQERIDLVDIVTQVRTHKSLVEMAVNRGLGTIVQKPFGYDLSECRQMTRLAQTSGTFLAVHENFRFQRPNRLSREFISEGAIGKPNWGRISFRTGYDIYAGQPYLLEETRFVVSDLGAHVLDLARYFFGEVESLTAELQKRNPNLRGEDTATMMLRHVSGAVSVVECTYEARRLPDVFPATVVELEGTEGAIVIDGDLSIELTQNNEMVRHDSDAPLLPWAERPWHVVQESVYRTCEHILGRFQAGLAAETSAADNLKTFALCEAAYESARLGRSIRPADLLA